MIRHDERTVTLTSAESVIKEWHDALLDQGYGMENAAWEIKDSVPQEGETFAVLLDSDFWYYLTGVSM